MHTISRGRATHADRLERWLGADQVKYLSETMGKFYYPVPVHGVPGNVFVMPGGDFAGEITAGQFMSKHDAAAATLRKLRNRLDAQHRREKAAGVLASILKAEQRELYAVGAFASIDAVVAAYTGGKGQTLGFSKTGVASNAIGNVNDLWTRAGAPAAGAAGAAAPGGTAWTAASTGAMPYKNLGATNSGHYLNWTLSANTANMGLLLYDRLFSVAAGAALTSGTSTAVTGVPTRYQNTTNTAVDYIGGNFAFPANPTTVLAATAHNWAVGTGAAGMMYANQAGTAANMPVIAGVSACVVGGVDLVVQNWFAPLAAGDIGIQKLTNMQSSAAVATGTIDWVIGHPIAVNVCPIANFACLDDGLYTSMNLSSILDNACLSFLELPKSATTATTYNGFFRTVSE